MARPEVMEIKHGSAFEARVEGDPDRAAELLRAWLESSPYAEDRYHEFSIKPPGMWSREVRVA